MRDSVTQSLRDNYFAYVNGYLKSTERRKGSKICCTSRGPANNNLSGVNTHEVVLLCCESGGEIERVSERVRGKDMESRGSVVNPLPIEREGEREPDAKRRGLSCKQ